MKFDDVKVKAQELEQEMIVDFDHMCIPVEEFKRMVEAEVTLKILEGLCRSFSTYDYDKVIRAVFGPMQEDDNHA